MRQVSTFSRSMFALLAAAGWLGVTMNVSAAHERTFTKACAEHDVKVMTLIEDHGAAAAPLVGNETLSKAGLMLIEARHACYGGREAEAVAIYDRIAAMLGPISVSQSN